MAKFHALAMVVALMVFHGLAVLLLCLLDDFHYPRAVVPVLFGVMEVYVCHLVIVLEFPLATDTGVPCCVSCCSCSFT